MILFVLNMFGRGGAISTIRLGWRRKGGGGGGDAGMYVLDCKK